MDVPAVSQFVMVFGRPQICNVLYREVMESHGPIPAIVLNCDDESDLKKDH
jgi:hypothetical protein